MNGPSHTIRVYSSKRINPKTGKEEYSRYYRTKENIEAMGATVINNWFGVEESSLDAEGKILATIVHRMMNPPTSVIKVGKPTIETLKAIGDVIPASELTKWAEQKAISESEFAKAAEEQQREDRDKTQGSPVKKTVRIPSPWLLRGVSFIDLIKAVIYKRLTGGLNYFEAENDWCNRIGQ